MTKNLQAINNKRIMINVMIEALKKNEKAKARIGGFTKEDLGEEVKFQNERLDVLEWAENHTLIEIRQRILDIEATLTTDILQLKYGLVRGIQLEIIKAISEIELLEIAIDEWGKHPGGWNE